MKIILLLLSLFLVFSGNENAQNISNNTTLGELALTNVPGLEFPRVDSQLRATFRVEAPDAGKVQLDLKEVYDMVKSEDGVWTVTTKPLDPGFHYYYLMIDGYRVSDPASETFFWCRKKNERNRNTST